MGAFPTGFGSIGRCAMAVTLAAAIAQPSLAQPVLVGDDRSTVHTVTGDASSEAHVKLGTSERDLTVRDCKSGEQAKRTSNTVAKTVVLSGVVDVFAFDDFDNRRSGTKYFLRTDDGTCLPLRIRQPARLVPGTPVSVTGIMSDDMVLIASEIHLVDSRFLRDTAPTVGEQRLVVLLVNSQGNPAEPFGAQEVETRIFDNAHPDSFAAWFEEVSYGRASLTGDVFGWYTVSLTQSGLCDTGLIYEAAIAAADSDVYFPDYFRVMVIIPNGPCPWCGIASLGSLASFDTDDGLVGFTRVTMNGLSCLDRTGLHELGHNFGMDHANDLECGETVIGDACDSIEYGDVFDVMGTTAYKMHFQSYFKEQIGWLLPQHVTEAIHWGVYRLEPLGTGSTGVKALRIPLTGDLHYYVEYRRPEGFDSGLLSIGREYYDGAVIHWDQHSYPGSITRSYLLDTSPHVTGFPSSQDLDSLDAVLRVGETFDDLENDLSITTLSVTDASLTVLLSCACVEGGTCDGPCDDGDPCTENDACVNAACQGRPVPILDCNDNAVPDCAETIEGGDFDVNGAVDLADVRALAGCLRGPESVPAPEWPECATSCLAAFDFDDDDDVDLHDYASFALNYSP